MAWIKTVEETVAQEPLHRDTRTVLAICLSVIENAPFEGAQGFGVFRT